MKYKINNYEQLEQFERIHIRINQEFFNTIKALITRDYKSFKRYNDKHLRINYGTLKWEFKENRYHPFHRILTITKGLGIPKQELYENIEGFYHRGSHRKKEIQIPEHFIIEEFFVEGYALYLAEGDTGFNGKTRPRKLRFTNSNVEVINHFINWVRTYLPTLEFCVDIILPKDKYADISNVEIKADKINIREGLYNKIPKYRVCLGSAIVIDLFLSIENKIKRLCLNNPNLAAAYLRGMMIGEGTAYFNKSRYVRIEMRNEKEIKYLHALLDMLGFDCIPKLRTTRENMWSLYIKSSQLSRFYNLIGFGIHKERQEILENSVNKKLRINQYC